MHPVFRKADMLTGKIIACAIEVHKELGPGLLESIYERCLMREFELQNIQASQQKEVKINYKGVSFGETLRFDVLVEQSVLIEAKASTAVFQLMQRQAQIEKNPVDRIRIYLG